MSKTKCPFPFNKRPVIFAFFLYFGWIFCDLDSIGRWPVSLPLAQAKEAVKSAENKNTLPQVNPNPESRIPVQMQDVKIEEKLGNTVDIQNLRFNNEAGESVTLSQFFHQKRPVLLSLVYYECPSLCNFVLNGLNEAMQGFDWNIGEKFDVVHVSINPKENAELARKKKASYVKALGKPGAEKGWHFLTGSEDQIQKLANQVGFKYKYDPISKEYAHGAAQIVLTPEGKISRYLYGISYAKTDLRLALLEASNGRIGNMVDRFVMLCYRYDPHSRGYGLYAFRLIQMGSLFMIAAVGMYLALFWRKQRFRTK